MIEITPEDLLQYLYKETSEQKAIAIKNALETDWNLRESYENLLITYKDLSEANFFPRPEVVNKILEYGAKTQQGQANLH